ncbi:MarR family transcriptional regulator [Tuanshanicoccus lijuaniae]|uniref:MarR family winged helix-turn-helix transcriptional regulator n=1 Tax=Aerococcaceae bacterium zg-1292 TaxID=2774330 RepID=UPI001935949B|nr:MarR family transcriptional regulator [Aerococcaceae bacterium zg-1292]MBF6626728.1 MarR family transcriptional regulator [Aerococcaceae bacterium zg-BR9]MBS4456673.1 MarR family transcriptional regulator [Aerococcaceae bacterium zg-A91]MBS4458465.1 MarR family transcriptional regulator [Aerococcaceae bacterium zg-BR33]QQA36587.1 MarR family transcriptional regulator [Aerococcaceae bacterium zg-1292]
MDISVPRHSCVHANIVFRQAARTIDLNSGKVFREYGLTRIQFSILDVLYSIGDMAICDLKDKILATSGNMTVVLKNMERDNLIVRRTAEEDKRKSVFQITEKGREIFEMVLPKHREELDELFGIYTQEEREQLITLLKKFKNV